MQQIQLTEEQRKKAITSTKRLIGQIKNIQMLIEQEKITPDIFSQLIAVKGGASRICRDIIVEGVLTQLNDYSKKDLEKAVDIILKLDK